MNYRILTMLLVTVGIVLSNLGCAGTEKGVQQPRLESDSQQTEIVAEVNGQVITAQTFKERAPRAFVFIEGVIYKRKQIWLADMINEILVQQEAERQGISKDSLIAEVKDIDHITVSDVEVSEFYVDNAELFPEGREAAREKIRRMVRQEKADEKLQEFIVALREKAQVAVFLSPPSDPGVQKPLPAARKGVVAEVNGTVITAKALEERMQSYLAGLEPTLREFKIRALKRTAIADMLVEEEAKKRGVSTEELFESVTHASTIPVSDEEVERVYRRVQGNPALKDEQKRKEYIMKRLRRSRAQPKWQEFIDGLEAKADIKIYLKAPTPSGAAQEGLRQRQNETQK